MNKEKIEELKLMLSCPEEDKKLYAINDLCDFSDEESYGLLIESLGNETSQIVKDSMLFVLKTKLTKNSFSIVFKMFSSEDAYIRNAAVSIFSCGGEETVEFLEGMFNYSNKEVKKLILDALFEIGTSSAAKAISKAIFDSAPNVKITAIEYIGRLGLEEQQETILRFFESEDEPMLLLSVLMSIQFFEKFSHISRIKSRLLPDGNFRNINSMYLGEYLKLIARFGSAEDQEDILKNLCESKLLTNEAVDYLIIAINRNSSLMKNASVRNLLITYFENPGLNRKMTFNLLQIVSNSDESSLKVQIERCLNDPDISMNQLCSRIAETLKLKKD